MFYILKYKIKLILSGYNHCVQKTHQQLADETNFHLVEFRRENDYLPVIVASPKGPVKTDPKDAPDFLQYVMDNKVRLRKKILPPFYTKKSHWYIKQKKMETIRNMDKVYFKY